jgi:hypothetical protein
MSTAWVVVLGDAGRSPRMQYHTLSLCRDSGRNVEVSVLGFELFSLCTRQVSYVASCRGNSR